MSIHFARSRMNGRAGAAWTVLVAAVVLGACDLSRILDVDLPGRVPEDALNDPTLAQVLVNGVIADVECAWNTYSAAASPR